MPANPANLVADIPGSSAFSSMIARFSGGSVLCAWSGVAWAVHPYLCPSGFPHGQTAPFLVAMARYSRRYRCAVVTFISATLASLRDDMLGSSALAFIIANFSGGSVL